MKKKWVITAVCLAVVLIAGSLTVNLHQNLQGTGKGTVAQPEQNTGPNSSGQTIATTDQSTKVLAFNPRADIPRVYGKAAQPPQLQPQAVPQAKPEQAPEPKVNTAPVIEGQLIVINKSKLTLTLYQDKSVVKQYRVAVGRSGRPTPSGKFNIQSKLVNPAWGGIDGHPPVAGGRPDNPLGVRWMGFTSDGSYGIHGTISPKSIGTRASSGCVRMYNKEVIDLFNRVAIGTPVWIGTNQQLAGWGISQ